MLQWRATKWLWDVYGHKWYFGDAAVTDFVNWKNALEYIRWKTEPGTV